MMLKSGVSIFLVSNKLCGGGATKRISHIPKIIIFPTPAKWSGEKPKACDENYMTKQCFWINNDYILEQIEDISDNYKKQKIADKLLIAESKEKFELN